MFSNVLIYKFNKLNLKLSESVLRKVLIKILFENMYTYVLNWDEKKNSKQCYEKNCIVSSYIS